MTAPIFILGCHRSGTSVVAGMLVEACGLSMGELMPATEDNPLGYFEAIGVVDAHRDLLHQMERDWTCPPAEFQPEYLDLTALEEQVAIHQELPGVWAMKDPRSMFLLPAWSYLGVDEVRLVAVVRQPADTVRSIVKRDSIREDRAEAIVDAYLGRLEQIAEQVPLPVIRFPGDEESVVDQVRRLAKSLDLPWDESAARGMFDESLVRVRSPLVNPTPVYQSLLEKASDSGTVPITKISELQLDSAPETPLETHLAVRHNQQRRTLWEMAHFSFPPGSDVVELLLDGARYGPERHSNLNVTQIEVSVPLSAGSLILNRGLRPKGVVAHGFLSGRQNHEVEYFFRSLYVSTDPLAEVFVDTADPHGQGLLNTNPAPPDHPRPGRVKKIASLCGWDHVATERLSPGRSGIHLRKRILTDSELVPVVTDLLSNTARVSAIDKRLAHVETEIELERAKAEEIPRAEERRLKERLELERQRADRAEAKFDRLRNRRSVRLALLMSRPAKNVFRLVRGWKNRRS